MEFTNLLKPESLLRKRLDRILIEYWKPEFRDFYFHRKRNKYILYVDGILKDLREIDDVLELTQNYSLTEFLTHLNLSEKFTRKEFGMIEDSAYYLRYLEINKGNTIDILKKDVLLGLNPLKE